MTPHQRHTIRKRDSDTTITTTLLNKPTNNKILRWEELPSWMQDNHFITEGYRRPTNSYLECIKTLFYLHNEYVNIWSHLLGFLLFVGLGIHFLWTQPFPDRLTWFDYIYFFIFIVGALTCLGFSSLFHCFSCHSEPVAAAWNRCDYAGITTLIVGSFFPVIYYGFHCHQLFQVVYLVTISVLGACTAAVVLLQHFRTPAYRWMRTSAFLALGLFGVVPALHGIYVYGFARSFDTISLINMLVMGGSYVAGALIYGARIPERWSPGSFNIWGASHQIFHVCVVIALISHYFGVMKAMAYWHSGGHEICKEFV
ncbi:putative hemolysin-III channel protein Izh2 [Halteromyces radiatus]|uniref:putative hemolysin-III channel protein Izh2 n=1 Tax=Halteromyces radiatus TaxID=101107 RepID=UPI00221ED39A|nr:putative hemolysin-III channel protein Izh2 [Halteromyces radiatus]KAI8098614.1 putative hemolysin-III channel protein Izh2 [Halteromyces radiatus]